MTDITCNCGRSHSNVTVLPLHCRCGVVCGKTVTSSKSPQIVPSPKSTSRYYSLQAWLNGLVGCNCVPALPYTTLPQRIAEEPRLGLSLERSIELVQQATTLYNRQFKDVAIITFHWNPHKFTRLRETYYEWIATMTHPVICYELVFGDDEPEIEGSIILRGDESNLLWQKERIINLALETLPCKYLAWIDHDMVFSNPQWLEDALNKLDNGVDAVQPFDSISFTDKEGNVAYTAPGGVATYKAGKMPDTCPGAAWIATRSFLERVGGVYENNIVGGGDAVMFHGLTTHRSQFLERQSPGILQSSQQWIDNLGTTTIDFSPGKLTHLWHGERSNRQYVSRDAILRKYDFDPAIHITIDPKNNLLMWTPSAPQGLRDEVKQYFLDRRDDGD